MGVWSWIKDKEIDREGSWYFSRVNRSLINFKCVDIWVLRSRVWWGSSISTSLSISIALSY